MYWKINEISKKQHNTKQEILSQPTEITHGLKSHWPNDERCFSLFQIECNYGLFDKLSLLLNRYISY